MSPAWDNDELAWALECAAAGDTAEEIAEMAGRSVADVRANVALPRLTQGQRTALQLYIAGATLEDIGRCLRPSSRMPKQLAFSYLKGLRNRGVPLPARCPGRSPDAEARRHG